MNEKKLAIFPCEWKAKEGLVVGYANKAIVDDGNDFIPADVWFKALQRFFREGMPVKLLHRPNLVVGETVWLKVVEDGLVLASRPTLPEIRGLIEKGLLRAYSIGYIPKDFKIREDGVREINDLDLVEVSYVDEPMNSGCYFELEMVKMLKDKEVIFDAQKGSVTVLGLTPEEMAHLSAQLHEVLAKAGVPEGAALTALEFKVADPKPTQIAVEDTGEEDEPVDIDSVDWDEVFDVYYRILDGEDVGEEKAKWTRRYINRLPDSSFAVIEPAYERGETKNKNARHLPHHGPGGGGTKNVNLDLPHLRNAFARAPLIKPVTDSITTEELRRRAMEHLEHHRSALSTYQEEGKKEGLLGTLQRLLELVRGEKKEVETVASVPDEVKADIESNKKAIEEIRSELNSFRESVTKDLGEFKEALNLLTNVVQALVPPQKSKTVLDTAGEKKQSKWGLFSR
jgi:hypothetical protein